MFSKTSYPICVSMCENAFLSVNLSFLRYFWPVLSYRLSDEKSGFFGCSKVNCRSWHGCTCISFETFCRISKCTMPIKYEPRHWVNKTCLEDYAIHVYPGTTRHYILPNVLYLDHDIIFCLLLIQNCDFFPK